MRLFVALVMVASMTQAVSVRHLREVSSSEANELEQLLAAVQPISAPETSISEANLDGRQSPAPAPPTTSPLSPLVSSVLSALGTAFTPLLGPLAPLAGAFGPVINNALTGVLTNGLQGLIGILKRDDLPNSGYDTFLVNIPNQGSYILMTKKVGTTPSETIGAEDSPQTLNQLPQFDLNSQLSQLSNLVLSSLITPPAKAVELQDPQHQFMQSPLASQSYPSSFPSFMRPIKKGTPNMVLMPITKKTNPFMKKPNSLLMDALAAAYNNQNNNY